MTGSQPERGATTWTQHYETLRRYMLEERQRLETQPLGLALWMAKGMAGWMGQWKQLLEPAAVSISAPPRWGGGEAGSGREALAVLLAQITLQHLEPRASL